MEDLNEMIKEAEQMKEADKVFAWCNSCGKYTYHFKTCDVIGRCGICGHGQWTESDLHGILPSLKVQYENTDDEEWFEEKCCLCGKYKMVHDYMMTNLGNPAFVCNDCEEKRARIFEEWVEDNKDWSIEIQNEDVCSLIWKFKQ